MENAMPRYGILASHEPNSCPGANQQVREFAEAILVRMDEISKKHGVEMGELLHLDPSHMTFGTATAPSIEAVRDFVLEACLDQWNNVQVYPVTPVQELMQVMAERPRLY
jgi:hypothetical protein